MMIDTVKSTVNKYNMFCGEKNITVALSGGADSVALLLCLLELKTEYGLSVSAAHLNHGMRGQEATRDENFCVELCKKLDVPLTIGHADVFAECKKTGESAELAARRVRYEFLNKASVGLIATAHNAGDSFETMLFNLSRGTGLKGLCGIPAVRQNIVRPIINCTREEILEYLNSKSTSFVVDSTNYSLDPSRNKIRLTVVPGLKAVNSSAVKCAARTAELLSTDNDFIEQSAAKLYNECKMPEGLNVAVLKSGHKALKNRVIARFLKEILNADIETVHVSAVNGIIDSGFGTVDLPNGQAVCFNGVLKATKGTFKPETFNISARVVPIEEYKSLIKINSLLTKNALDYDKISGTVLIRKRQTGDSLKLNGCTKTLKKLYNEYKVPLTERENLPVVQDDAGVVLVYNIGAASRVKVSKSTKSVMIFE